MIAGRRRVRGGTAGGRLQSRGVVLAVALGLLPSSVEPGAAVPAGPDGGPSTSGRGLALRVSLDRTTVGPGEAVEARLRLSNQSGARLVVNGRLAVNSPWAPEPMREVVFTVVGPSGRPLSFGAKIRIGHPRPEHFRLLAPGESLEDTCRLDRYFTLTEPGRYSVSAVYQSTQDPGDGRAAWKGRVTSNTEALTVASRLEP